MSKGLKEHGSCIYTGYIVNLDVLFRILHLDQDKHILQYELMNMSLQLIFSACLSVYVFTTKMHNSNIYLQYREKRFVHVLMMAWQPNFRKKKLKNIYCHTFPNVSYNKKNQQPSENMYRLTFCCKCLCELKTIPYILKLVRKQPIFCYIVSDRPC